MPKTSFQSKKEIAVVVVEGDADELIMNKLFSYYREKGWNPNFEIKVKNIGGFPDESKIRSKLEQIRHSLKSNRLEICFRVVCCEFDTDVIIKGLREAPDWNKVERKLMKDYRDVKGFCTVEAETSIEDWMLDDLDGLLRVLKLPDNTKVVGQCGLDKVSNLFRKKNIHYDRNKGKKTIEPIISQLDIEKIRNVRMKELKKMEELFGINIR